ncbi:MAG: GNAT family N-acetyltransferase [Acholeplasmatales bacterium]|nr:GNAT family N-acetyltransferase [Acholeplasmatales bacterium]
MKIIEFNNEQFILKHLENHPWVAGRYLYELIKDNNVYDVLGNDTKIIVMVDGENIVSFATYANQDCIRDESLFPWIGFVYTEEKYRKNRYSQAVINYILDKAKSDGHKRVYIATDHEGLYEKFGFKYLESRIDIYDDLDRIYIYDLN